MGKLFLHEEVEGDVAKLHQPENLKTCLKTILNVLSFQMIRNSNVPYNTIDCSYHLWRWRDYWVSLKNEVPWRSFFGGWNFHFLFVIHYFFFFFNIIYRLFFFIKLLFIAFILSWDTLKIFEDTNIISEIHDCINKNHIVMLRWYPLPSLSWSLTSSGALTICFCSCCGALELLEGCWDRFFDNAWPGCCFKIWWATSSLARKLILQKGHGFPLPATWETWTCFLRLTFWANLNLTNMHKCYISIFFQT